MDRLGILGQVEIDALGNGMFELIKALYPICRSITGNGVRETLRIIGQRIPLEIHEVASGTRVFDWTVPNEWNVRDAYIKNSAGNKVVDFNMSNLHLVGYSIPIHQRMPLSELKEHLYSIPEHPDWIPYRTSYYSETWGFCLSHRTLQQLEDGEYEICIDTTLKPGFLTYGECYLRGESTDEILLSCHCCHPSLCNDNLSGIALVTFLANYLTNRPRRYSYRFLFGPVTIGAITWLAANESKVGNIKHGLVVASVGDSGKLTYKRSRRGNAEIDQAAVHVLQHLGSDFEITEFSPYGYDERQYCSPGFDLPMGSLTRTPYGQYPEYHTSADNLSFVQAPYLADSLLTYIKVLHMIESNRSFLNTNPKCEPQLGSRGLYSNFGGRKAASPDEYAMLWVLNLSDGSHTLLDISVRSKIGFDRIARAADLLLDSGLLEDCL